MKHYYSFLCGKLKEGIGILKYNYYDKLIDNCKRDSGQQWKIVNGLTGNTRSNKLNKLVLDNGTKIEKMERIAEELNRHLVNIIGATVNESQGGSYLLPNCLPPNLILYWCYCPFWSYKWFENKISPYFDNINVDLIKQIATITSPILSYTVL